jgi:hypothetical protein
MTILQLLARADTEYKLLLSLGQWTTKNKSSELLGCRPNLMPCRLSLSPF